MEPLVAYLVEDRMPIEYVVTAADEYDADLEWDRVITWAEGIAEATFEFANVQADRQDEAELRAVVHGSLSDVARETLRPREEWLALRTVARPRGWAAGRGELMRELENARKRARRAAEVS